MRYVWVLRVSHTQKGSLVIYHRHSSPPGTRDHTCRQVSGTSCRSHDRFVIHDNPDRKELPPPLKPLGLFPAADENSLRPGILFWFCLMIGVRFPTPPRFRADVVLSRSFFSPLRCSCMLSVWSWRVHPNHYCTSDASRTARYETNRNTNYRLKGCPAMILDFGAWSHQLASWAPVWTDSTQRTPATPPTATNHAQAEREKGVGGVESLSVWSEESDRRGSAARRVRVNCCARTDHGDRAGAVWGGLRFEAIR